MTNKELEIFRETRDMVYELRQAQELHKQGIDAQIDAIKNRIEQKHVPIEFEPKILGSIQESLQSVIKDTLGGYSSPLRPIIDLVISEHKDSITTQFSEMMKLELNNSEFKTELRKALSQKLAKSLMAGVDKSVDSATDELKRNPEFSARLKLLVIGLVEEFTCNSQSK